MGELVYVPADTQTVMWIFQWTVCYVFNRQAGVYLPARRPD